MVRLNDNDDNFGKLAYLCDWESSKMCTAAGIFAFYRPISGLDRCDVVGHSQMLLTMRWMAVSLGCFIGLSLRWLAWYLITYFVDELHLFPFRAETVTRAAAAAVWSVAVVSSRVVYT